MVLEGPSSFIFLFANKRKKSMEARILKFIEATGKLKEVERTGWRIRGVEAPESVAEHSYRTAVIAMVLSDLEGRDTGKAVKMALLHDLQESIVGDLTRRSPNYSEKRELEEEAILRILRELPGDISDEYMKIWREYSEGTTPEAKLVKNADKLDMLAQAREYEKQGYEVEDFWKGEYDFEGLSKKIYQMLRK
jgi:putative hydrolase of HD superfamily